MKNLKDIITEKLTINSKSKIVKYNYFPKTKDDLQKLIEKLIKERGDNADLNDIDVSKITDMSYLFDFSKINNFVKNIDISKWNVSNVKDMNSMFWECVKFNCDLSNWDVSNVEDMSHMFCNCYKFNCDLSNWDVSNVKTMRSMFFGCKKFNSDLSNWNITNVENMRSMFDKCFIKKNPPKWYKE